MSTHSQTVTEKRKVARIVFDRPPLKKLSFLLWSLAGLALGILLGLLLHWLWFSVGDATTKVDEFWRTNECWEWGFPLGLVGLLAGMAIGWGYKREVRARIEMVEQPTMQRRRSSSTAMVRVDYGRRW